jgi:hypothetical protein
MKLIRAHKFVMLLLGSFDRGFYVKIGRRNG